MLWNFSIRWWQNFKEWAKIKSKAMWCNRLVVEFRTIAVSSKLSILKSCLSRKVQYVLEDKDIHGINKGTNST